MPDADLQTPAPASGTATGPASASSDSAAPGRSLEEPGEGRRRILRWLYFPYTWLVFIPFLAVTTVVMGCLAVVVAVFAPRVAFHFGTVWAWMLCHVNPTWVTVEGREHAALMKKKAKARKTKFGDVAGVLNPWLHEEGRRRARR